MSLFFHKELDQLKLHLMRMAELAHTAVDKSIHALIEHDAELAKAVLREDDIIDQLEIDIDHEANQYLTLRSPVATDLRLITTALKASQDLERIGDEARSIAKRTISLLTKSGGPGNDLGRIPEMAEHVSSILRDTRTCFFSQQLELARSVIADDEVLDKLNKHHFKVFVAKAEENPPLARRYFDLLLISKCLERIGDHATNLAEETIFLLTAQEARHRQA